MYEVAGHLSRKLREITPAASKAYRLRHARALNPKPYTLHGNLTMPPLCSFSLDPCRAESFERIFLVLRIFGVLGFRIFGVLGFRGLGV